MEPFWLFMAIAIMMPEVERRGQEQTKKEVAESGEARCGLPVRF